MHFRYLLLSFLLVRQTYSLFNPKSANRLQAFTFKAGAAVDRRQASSIIFPEIFQKLVDFCKQMTAACRTQFGEMNRLYVPD